MHQGEYGLAKLLVIPILITFVISVAATFYMGKKAPTPSPSYSEPPPATGMDKNITSTSNSADTVIAQPTPTPLLQLNLLLTNKMNIRSNSQHFLDR